MTPGSPGLMGALLIVIGLAFALLAIAVVLNRRDSEAERAEEPDEPAEGDSEALEEIPPEQALENLPVPQGEEAPEAREDGPVRPAEPQPPSPRALLPVAELLREEVTGKLVLRLGDQVVRSAGEIQSEADRRKIQYASADLADWFRGLEVPARPKRPAGEARRGSRRAEPAQPAEPGPGDAGSADQGGADSRPVSMIEAINAILERQAAETEGAPRAVRLVPDPTGGVRVLLGVKSYPLEEVPDESIKSLIRQAVAEWEESQ